MIRLLTFVFILFFSFQVQVLQAAYRNPVLKVLLMKSPRAVVLHTYGRFSVEGVTLSTREQQKIQINKVHSRRVKLNNWATRDGSLMISSTKPIRINGRGYEGKIEVKPYAKGLYVINHIRTEDYLQGVLNAEISTRWPIESVKAQAVIARTYALFKRNKRKKYIWHLTSNAGDQVYKGVDIADHFGDYAIENTRGLVVTYNGHLIPTFYHSNSGGITEDPGNLWQYSMPHLKPVHTQYGKSDPRYYWSAVISPEELSRILYRAGYRVKYPHAIFISERTSSGRAKKVVISGNKTVEILASKLRQFSGYSKIQSLLFDVRKSGTAFVFEGTGNGHGVGLSQWAAKDMAEVGYNFQEILRFFYRNIDIDRFRG